MSRDHYRNISFSAYIENACFNCTGKFSENVLRIFPHFHVDVFLPMWPLLSKPLCISMRRRKNVLFSTQSKKKSVNLGTEPVFILPDTHSEHHLENVFLCLKLCLEQPEMGHRNRNEHTWDNMKCNSRKEKRKKLFRQHHGCEWFEATGLAIPGFSYSLNEK